jgi:hypothetical protein
MIYKISFKTFCAHFAGLLVAVPPGIGIKHALESGEVSTNKHLLPRPDVRRSVKFANQKRVKNSHGLEIHKNCGRVAAGISSGSLPGFGDVWNITCGEIMLLPWPALLQNGVLRRAERSFRSCCACPVLFPK